MSNYSENNSFDDILERLLDNVDPSLDTRQGSIIYDALAPAAAELAQCYIALDVFSDQTYLLDAVNENLDNRVVDYGLVRREATYAQRTIEVYDTNDVLMDVDIGTRFAIPNDFGGYNFEIISKKSTGTYIAQCETAGSVGNEYIGDLLPLVSVNNLGSATLSDIDKPGEDAETDDELRERALQKINQEAFGGNKAAYKKFVNDIDGAEKSKIFPIWDGGGTVKVAIIAANNTIPTETFVNEVQEMIDPIQYLEYKCDGTETGTYHFTYNGNNYQFIMPTIEANDILRFNTITLKLYKSTTEITTTSGTSGTSLTFMYVPSTDPQGQGLGIAPIGHKVTVVAPTKLDINITATITPKTGYTVAELETSIKEQIGKYITEVQEEWEDNDTLIVYTSKVIAAILGVEQVQNVSNLTINSSSSDLTINITSSNVVFPILNLDGVVLNES